MILASLINENHERTDAMCENCTEDWLRNGYSIEQMFNSDTQACSECGRKETKVSADKLVTLHLTHFLNDGSDFQGKRDVYHASMIPIAKAMEIIAEYDVLHDEGRLQIIEVHLQYHKKPE
jgi:hypothetical protein